MCLKYSWLGKAGSYAAHLRCSCLCCQTTSRVDRQCATSGLWSYTWRSPCHRRVSSTLLAVRLDQRNRSLLVATQPHLPHENNTSLFHRFHKICTTLMLYLLCVTRSCSSLCVVQTIFCIISYHPTRMYDTAYETEETVINWLFLTWYKCTRCSPCSNDFW